MRKNVFAILFLLVMFGFFGAKQVSAQVPCVSGKECADFKVSYDDKTEYGIPLSASSVQFYDTQATKDKICQVKGYEFNPGALWARTYNAWSSCSGNEYHVDWRGNWDIHKCGGVSYLDTIICARTPASTAAPSVNISVDPTIVSFGNQTDITWTSQNTTSCVASGDWSGPKALSGVEQSANFFFLGTRTYTITCQSASGETVTDSATARLDVLPSAPTIAWASIPTTVASGAIYEISAAGNDTDGDLTRIQVLKSVNGGASTSFEQWIGGGYSGSTWSQTSDTGPATITYTAFAQDARGNTSSVISRKVTISAPVTVTPDTPTITWTSNPSTVASGEVYRIEARGQDANGNLVAVSVDKNGIPFAYAPGGDGYSNISGNSTADTGPDTINYTAWATDATGLRSPVINHTVTVGGLTPTATVSTGGVTCVNPGGSFTVTGTASGSGIWSNVLEKDSNQDGVYGSIATRSDAGTNSVTVYVPSTETSPRYDFRTNVNSGTVLSAVASVTISSSCGVPVEPGWFCTTFPALCPGPATNYTLSVAKSGSGTGSVDGGGISCGSTCSKTVSSGTAVMLVATPGTDSTFTGWSGGGCSGTGVCVVNVTGNTSVIATFTAIGLPPGPAGGTCRVTIPRDGPLSVSLGTAWGVERANLSWNSVTSYCAHSWGGMLIPRTQSGTFSQAVYSPNSYGWSLYCWKPGSSSFTPDAGEYVVGVSCAPESPTGSVSATLSANYTCAKPTENVMFTSTANGSPITSHYLEYDNDADGSYTKEVNFPAMSGPINYTKPYATGVYKFRSVVNGSVYSNVVDLIVNPSCPVVPPVTTNYTLTVTKSGTGSGTITGGAISCGATCSQSVPSGTTIVLTATPAVGSTFNGWSGGGCSGTGTCTVLVDGNKTITATYTSTSGPVGGTCTDSTAINFGDSLPCRYGGSGPRSDYGFTLSGDTKASLHIGVGGGLETNNRFLNVNPVGTFNSPVTVTVKSILSKVTGASLPATTVVTYTFDGGTTYVGSMNELMTIQPSGYYANSRGTLGLPYRIKFSEALTGSYLVTFQAVGGGITTTHVMEVDPRLNPNFEEI